jgi:protoheme IX farnesyltransferase
MSLDTARPPAALTTHRTPEVETDWETARSKAAALVELTKPRIAVMVLLTVAIGFWLGSYRSPASPWAFVMALVGTGMVAAGASVWNQILEAPRDALMRRTARRPIPSARVTPSEAAWFGSALAVGGMAILLAGCKPPAATIAGVTFLLYVLIYTPLKTRTTFNTFVGAIPGALPPVIGWTAAAGQLGVEPLALFLIMFLWQFPHFLAIAWIHREDYARGGMKMVPLYDPTGKRTSRQSLVYALALVPVALWPVYLGIAGPWYGVGALLLSLYYLNAAIGFWLQTNETTARRLMRSSFVHLPGVLMLLLLNPLPV